jgi:hypothetical protein
MKKLSGLIALAGLATVALAATGWIAQGRGEFSTEQGDAYFEIRGEQRGNGNNAVGSARMVIKDEEDRPILGVDLPQAQGQFNKPQHDVLLRGPGGVRTASGVTRGPVSVLVHDGGPNGTDHVKVTAGNRTWEGDIEEGNLIVAPRR